MLVSQVQGFLWLNNQPLRDNLPVEEAADGRDIMSEVFQPQLEELTAPRVGMRSRVQRTRCCNKGPSMFL